MTKAGLVVVSMLTIACGGSRSDGELRPAPATHANADSAAAYAEATAWLALVDAGMWQASLDRAAPLLRQMAGTADSWASFIGQARARYPVRPPRRLVSWEPGYTAQAGPPGEYARLLLASGTAPPTRETVVLVRGPAGWQVAMYSAGGR